jgi:endonuclease YncB( thermonuclease family)
MGLLRIAGVIELDQFWPTSNSDADTTKVHVRVDASSFEFSVDGSTGFAPVPELATATVLGEIGDVRVVKTRAADQATFVTVRVEGVDAPELHYRPTIPIKHLSKTDRQPFNDKNGEFRQSGAEAATVALAGRLAVGGATEVTCTVSTVVDAPNEVFDVYGRFIGVIAVTESGGPFVVNDWLLVNGWALPSFYTSSTIDEIDRLTALADTAWQSGFGVWPQYSYALGTFDRQQRYRRPTTKPAVSPDTGAFILPKVFRRFAQWQIARDAKLAVPTSFKSFVSSGAGNAMHTLDEFRNQGLAAATVSYIGDYLNDNNEFTLAPEEFIFREKASTLRHADHTPFNFF